MDGIQGEGDVAYLLLHLADLEFVRAQLSIILSLVSIAILLLDDVLHLSHEGTTSSTNSLAGGLQAVLGLAHEGCLDTTGCNKLGSAGCNIV